MAAAGTDSSETTRILLENKDDKFLNILVTGKTGVGKSRLVNALAGGNAIKEKGACEGIAGYEATIKDVAVKVWDSPGLQDGTTDEDRYIQGMKENIKEIALMVYCVRMDEARFYEADKITIRILTKEFGKEVWKHAVVALTFANKVEDPDGEDELQYFEAQLQEWKKQFQEYFTSVGVDPEVCIPVIPAGSTKKTSLPDRGNWLSDLRTESYRVMEPCKRLGMYKFPRTWFQTVLAVITYPWTVVRYYLEQIRRHITRT